MKRRASTAILIVYWLVLPLLALALLSLGPIFANALQGAGLPLRPVEWLSLAAIPVVAVLVIWRIRLHLKARARGAERSASMDDLGGGS